MKLNLIEYFAHASLLPMKYSQSMVCIQEEMVLILKQVIWLVHCLLN